MSINYKFRKGKNDYFDYLKTNLTKKYNSAIDPSIVSPLTEAEMTKILEGSFAYLYKLNPLDIVGFNSQTYSGLSEFAGDLEMVNAMYGCFENNIIQLVSNGKQTQVFQNGKSGKGVMEKKFNPIQNNMNVTEENYTDSASISYTEMDIQAKQDTYLQNAIEILKIIKSNFELYLDIYNSQTSSIYELEIEGDFSKKTFNFSANPNLYTSKYKTSIPLANTVGSLIVDEKSSGYQILTIDNNGLLTFKPNILGIIYFKIQCVYDAPDGSHTIESDQIEFDCALYPKPAIIGPSEISQSPGEKEKYEYYLNFEADTLVPDYVSGELQDASEDFKLNVLGNRTVGLQGTNLIQDSGTIVLKFNYYFNVGAQGQLSLSINYNTKDFPSLLISGPTYNNSEAFVTKNINYKLVGTNINTSTTGMVNNRNENLYISSANVSSATVLGNVHEMDQLETFIEATPFYNGVEGPKVKKNISFYNNETFDPVILGNESIRCPAGADILVNYHLYENNHVFDEATIIGDVTNNPSSVSVTVSNNSSCTVLYSPTEVENGSFSLNYDFVGKDVHKRTSLNVTYSSMDYDEPLIEGDTTGYKPYNQEQIKNYEVFFILPPCSYNVTLTEGPSNLSIVTSTPNSIDLSGESSLYDYAASSLTINYNYSYSSVSSSTSFNVVCQPIQLPKPSLVGPPNVYGDIGGSVGITYYLSGTPMPASANGSLLNNPSYISVLSSTASSFTCLGSPIEENQIGSFNIVAVTEPQIAFPYTLEATVNYESKPPVDIDIIGSSALTYIYGYKESGNEHLAGKRVYDLKERETVGEFGIDVSAMMNALEFDRSVMFADGSFLLVGAHGGIGGISYYENNADLSIDHTVYNTSVGYYSDKSFNDGTVGDSTNHILRFSMSPTFKTITKNDLLGGTPGIYYTGDFLAIGQVIDRIRESISTDSILPIGASGSYYPQINGVTLEESSVSSVLLIASDLRYNTSSSITIDYQYTTIGGYAGETAKNIQLTPDYSRQFFGGPRSISTISNETGNAHYELFSVSIFPETGTGAIPNMPSNMSLINSTISSVDLVGSGNYSGSSIALDYYYQYGSSMELATRAYIKFASSSPTPTPTTKELRNVVGGDTIYKIVFSDDARPTGSGTTIVAIDQNNNGIIYSGNSNSFTCLFGSRQYIMLNQGSGVVDGTNNYQGKTGTGTQSTRTLTISGGISVYKVSISRPTDYTGSATVTTSLVSSQGGFYSN